MASTWIKICKLLVHHRHSLRQSGAIKDVEFTQLLSTENVESLQHCFRRLLDEVPRMELPERHRSNLIKVLSQVEKLRPELREDAAQLRKALHRFHPALVDISEDGEEADSVILEEPPHRPLLCSDEIPEGRVIPDLKQLLFMMRDGKKFMVVENCDKALIVIETYRRSKTPLLPEVIRQRLAKTKKILLMHDIRPTQKILIRRGISRQNITQYDKPHLGAT